MASFSGGRPSFREWVDRQHDPHWTLMPLTHITKGIVAEDIIRDGEVALSDCAVFEEPLAYFFYGRPAYRLGIQGSVRAEAACPYCFVFKADLLKRAKAIFLFDTGAFSERLYKHYLDEEMAIERRAKFICWALTGNRTYFEFVCGSVPRISFGNCSNK